MPRHTLEWVLGKKNIRLMVLLLKSSKVANYMVAKSWWRENENENENFYTPLLTITRQSNLPTITFNILNNNI